MDNPSPKIALDQNPDPRVNGGGEEEKSQNEQEASIKVDIVDGDKAANGSGSFKSKKSVTWSHDLVSESPSPPRSTPDSAASAPPFDKANPYVVSASAPSNNPTSSNFKSKVETVKGVLGRWGKKVGEASRKAEDFAGNTWQHLKTGPSFADAALGRIAQGTKVLAEGGYEKVFRQTFETATEEQLIDSFACYLSTSAGPVMGTLYVSTAKLAYCSDSPLSYKADEKTEWSYYKVVIPLHQLKAVNPSTSRTNSSEKYIQVTSVDNHEFWLMGFLNYSGALRLLKDALEERNLQSV